MPNFIRDVVLCWLVFAVLMLCCAEFDRAYGYEVDPQNLPTAGYQLYLIGLIESHGHTCGTITYLTHIDEQLLIECGDVLYTISDDGDNPKITKYD